MQRGDTLVEVLFAITIFSFIAVAGMAIMNQGTASAQRSLEMTLVREEIDSQAEALRLIHDSYVAAYPNDVSGPAAEWSKIVTRSISQASTFGTCAPPSSAIIINNRTAVLEQSSKITPVVATYSRLRFTTPTSTVLTSAEGIWVEAVRSKVIAGEPTGYIDFHIRACWASVGQAQPITLGTIVRLYEPR
jgi:type II secretory pathway pseudopilin PulG